MAKLTTNGVDCVNGHTHEKAERVWETVSQTFPTRDKDAEIWWQLTGRHLATLVTAAGYSPKRQFESLTFHYNWTIPRMGAAPKGSHQDFKSFLQLDGTPLEYSWKWNTTRNPPDVRYSVEPIGQYAGEALDPLNQYASRELLHQLAKSMPNSINLKWTDHFFSTLFDHDMSKYEEEKAQGASLISSTFLAIELLESGPSVKTYFCPRVLGQVGTMSTERYVESIAGLIPESESRTALLEFLETSPSGKLLKPFCLAVDNVDPARARLKWYFNSPHTSFASVREIMSLGGRIKTPQLDKQLEELFALIRIVADLPKDWPEDKDVPTATNRILDPAIRKNFVELPDLLSGNLYFFDLAPGKALPEIKFYTPVRNFGRDDLSLAQGLTSWMESRGRGAYGAGYIRALQTLSSHRHLHSGSGVQTFLSCQFKGNGELDITSYLSPEAFHPERLDPTNKTRLRRGDGW